MKNDLAPIVIFTYRRIITETIDTLCTNALSIHSDLYIFSDGHKNETDLEDVEEVRKYLHTIKGFKNISIVESSENKGLANSIINGVSSVLDKHDKVIVLEDDLIVSSDFLTYMNSALSFYKTDERIWAISGYGPNLPCLENYVDDLYLSLRGSSWGWASWKNRWDKVDWEIKDFEELKQNRSLQNNFNLAGNDMYKMLELQMSGGIDSWFIRNYYTQFKQKSYTIYPKKSKIINDGFTDDKGVHTGGAHNKWVVILDNDKINIKALAVDSKLMKCFKKFHDLSLVTRIGYFLRKHGGYNLAKKIYKIIKLRFPID